MNYSYLIGVNNVTELIDAGFIIEEIDGDYGVKFPKDKEKQYEEFVIKNLMPGYWNEYLGDKFVFIFKFPNNTIKKYIYNQNNEQEIFKLCCEFAEYEFLSFIQMLKDTPFYAQNYFKQN